MELQRETIFQKLQLALERGGILGKDAPESYDCLAEVATVFFNQRGTSQGVYTWARCEQWLENKVPEEKEDKQAYMEFDRLIEVARTICTQKLASWTADRDVAINFDQAVLASLGGTTRTQKDNLSWQCSQAWGKTAWETNSSAHCEQVCWINDGQVGCIKPYLAHARGAAAPVMRCPGCDAAYGARSSCATVAGFM